MRVLGSQRRSPKDGEYCNWLCDGLVAVSKRVSVFVETLNKPFEIRSQSRDALQCKPFEDLVEALLIFNLPNHPQYSNPNTAEGFASF